MDENAKKPENRKKRSIISQISTPMVVFLVSVIIVNAIVLFIYNINRYITVRYERQHSPSSCGGNESLRKSGFPDPLLE